MHRQPTSSCSLSSRRAVVLALTSLVLSGNAFGQQEYVGRYDAYVGYAYLNSPHISLNSSGVHLQTGLRIKSWLSTGFDFSDSSGRGLLTPNLLTDALQQTLGAQLKQLAALGMLPSGYSLAVPFNASTRTYEAGPQLAYRRFTMLSLFVRPALGAVQQIATPRPTDPIANVIVQQLTPAGKKTDWQYFYGFGAGATINMTQHTAINVQMDLVRDHLFNDILKDGRWTIRLAVGPNIQWGRNMMK